MSSTDGIANEKVSLDSTEGILKNAIIQLIGNVSNPYDLIFLMGQISNINSNNEVLKEAFFKLIKDVSGTGDLNHLLTETTKIIEYRREEELFLKQQLIDSNNPTSQYVNENNNEVGETKVEVIDVDSKEESTFNNKPSFSEMLKRDLPPSTIVSSISVTSTNSSRNSGQQHSIRGITIFDDETIEKMSNNPEMNKNIEKITSKNKKIINIDILIKSLLDCGVPMWRIMFYFYISNKEFDISASTSSEDARQNDKKFQILEDYSNNNLINFNDTDYYYQYIEYYFDKTIAYNSENDYYICKKDKSGNPIVLIFKNKFVKLINNFIKK
jgi:hypothetical protein